jgi:hypothetical protein
MAIPRNRIYDTVEELEDRINAYFDWCDTQRVAMPSSGNNPPKLVNMPYTMSGLCLYLNIDLETFDKYSKNEYYRELLENARLRVESWLEVQGLLGVTNSAMTMFSLKNRFGWRDRQEIENINNDKGLDKLSFDELVDMAKQIISEDESRKKRLPIDVTVIEDDED